MEPLTTLLYCLLFWLSHWLHFRTSNAHMATNFPTLHVPPQLNAIPLLDNVSHKRSFAELDDDTDAGPAKRPARSSDVVYRLLVPSSKVGKLIGKQGVQIRQLREESGANIKISDAGAGTEDRVIMISSKNEDSLLNSYSAAQYAFIRVANMVIEEHEERSAISKSEPQQWGNPSLMRLLIGRSQAGCLIGKCGSSINEIRDASGAGIRILAPNQMPHCSFASETDRLVQISGELFQVKKALEIIATKLKENPPKERVSLKPSYHQQLMLYAQAAYPGCGLQQFANGDSTTSVYGPLDSQALGIGRVSTLPKITAEMRIPSALMGGVIGRGGINITQIRTFSGCAVKIYTEEDGAKERLITFEGTAEQVSAAQTLVQKSVNAQS